MKKTKFYIVLVLAALFVAFGVTHSLKRVHQTYQLNRTQNISRKADKTSKTSFFTRSNMDQINSQLTDSKYLAPTIDHKELEQTIPGAKVYSAKEKKMVPMDVWDSWPVQKPDGTLASFHGYRLVIGLTAENGRYSGAPTRMGLFAQPESANQDDLSTWQFVGYLFNSKKEGVAAGDYDNYLKSSVGEWSGSTYLMNDDDDSLRVFYANAYDDKKTACQILTTAKVVLEPKSGQDWTSGFQINHDKASDRKTVFSGDGKIYQTAAQGGGKRPHFEDDLTLRDPHFVQDGDKYYLIFEGNTGPNFNPQGSNNFNTQAYFGNKSYFNDEKKRLSKNQNTAEYDKTFFANSAIGKLELNKNFTVKKVMEPMVTGNATNDELERVNLFQHNGRWYLFTSTWGFHMATDNKKITDNSYMLGWSSSDGINGKYQPLNGNGTVIIGDGDQAKPTMTYPYLVIPNGDDKNDKFIVTSFEGNKTFAPSYLLKMKGNSTSMINNKILGQGVLTDQGSYYSARPQKIVK